MIHDQLNETLKYFNRRGEDQSLGFPDIERCYDFNGYPPGTHTILQAKSKVGKTLLLVNSVKYLIDNKKKVLFNSMDMVGWKIVAMLTRLILKMEPRDIRLDCEHKGTDWIKTAIREAGVYEYLRVFDKRGANVTDIRREIDEWEPDVVFTDYLQAVSSSKDKTDSFRHVTEVAQQMMGMAQQTQKIFFTLSQIGRGAVGEKDDDGAVMPGISASFGSGIIEASVDCLISACRKDIKDSCHSENRGTIEFKVVASRFGRSGVPTVYHYSPLTTELIHQDKFTGFKYNKSKYEYD